jgi:hypothetical protein
MDGNEVLVCVEISQRTRQIQVTTMVRGKGRHNTYRALQQAPEAVRGEALRLILDGVRSAGYASLAHLDHALMAPLVMPMEDVVVPEVPSIFAGESLDMDDDAFRMGTS